MDQEHLVVLYALDDDNISVQINNQKGFYKNDFFSRSKNYSTVPLTIPYLLSVPYVCEYGFKLNHNYICWKNHYKVFCLQ
jgi:hypothetical protein